MKKHTAYLSVLVSLLFISTISVTNLKTEAAENKIIVEKASVTDEFDTIKEAIDSVGDNESAVISVPAGTYDEAVVISNTGSLNRSIVLKGAQAGNSAVINGGKRIQTETILTNGIEISGLHKDASLTIDGFTLHHKGMNMLGWGNRIDSTGSIRIVNNVITDVENGSISAIHVNTDANNEFITALEVSGNYIENIGQIDYATNGVYITLSIDDMKINNNVIRNVNHTCINFASSVIKKEATVTNNIIADWNRDGAKGSGAGGSEGDGIYITKVNTPNTIPIAIHHNSITRTNTLPGNKGYAVRCSYNKGDINLNENFWDTKLPLSVISGGTNKNVTLSSVCDENMTVKAQSVGGISFYTDTLYAGGKTFERKLSANVTMLDSTAAQPTVVYTNDTPEIISIETRDDGVYYIAQKAGEGKITAVVTDSVSKEEYSISDTFTVKDIEMLDQTIEVNQSIQMIYKVLPEGNSIPSYYKTEWKSSDETIATVDENGLVTSTGKAGTANIEVSIKSYSTLYYRTSAVITVKEPFVNTPPHIEAQDKTLTVKDSFDPLKDITAFDNEDGDLSDAIKIIENTVDTDQAGVYHITYQVADSEGAVTTKTVTITVKALETVQITVAAMAEGETGIVAAEYEYVKGYKMEAEGMQELILMLEALNSKEPFKSYQYLGIFLDKEGNKPLELDYQYNEDTLIYILYRKNEIDNKPTLPPSKPNLPTDNEPSKPVMKPILNNNSNQANKVVNTGDSTSIMPYICILSVILFGLTLYGLFEKKKRSMK